MSVGRIVGAAIGFAVGGPQGAMYGYQIGGMIDGPQGADVHGPRLSDLTQQTSAYGVPIPSVYGTMRLAGNVFWGLPIRETKHKESGKGGGGQASVSYTYDASYAVSICEGPITGIRRIWANGKLIYDFSDAVTAETIIASNQAADGITIYTGSETQDPDPLIQVSEGVANTPAYRGRAYIVFDGLQLEDYGNIRPSISVEVVSVGTATGLRYLSTAQSEVVGQQYLTYTAQKYNDGTFDLLSWDSADQGDQFGLVATRIAIDGTIIKRWRVVTDPDFGYYWDINGWLEEQVVSGARHHAVCLLNGNKVWVQESISSITSVAKVGDEGTLGYQVINLGGSNDIFTNDFRTGFGSFDSALDAGGFTGKYYKSAWGSHDEQFVYIGLGTVSSVLDSWVKLDADKNIIDSGTVSPTIGAELVQTGRGVASDHAIVMMTDERHIWSVISNVGSSYTIRTFELDDAGNITTTASLARTPGGTLSRISMVVDKGVAFVTYEENNNFYIDALTREPLLTSSGVSLQTVVDDILTDAGLVSSQYDTSALSADTVDGYTRAKLMSARAAIQPLQKAYLFDAWETDKLTFVKRGGASVVSIPEEDLGATTNAVATDILMQTRQQESELPSKVIINYVDKDRDYQQGSQHAQRINVNHENVQTIELPLALHADRAKQLAEIAQYNAWIEREKLKFSLTTEYIQRNPTDVVTVNYKGYARIARLTQVNYGPVLTCEAAMEDGTVYTSNAVAGESDSVAQTVGITGPTLLELMDIPLLRNQDNESGIYGAVAGVFAGWSGAQLYKSLDGGISYSTLHSFFEASVIGTAETVLADHASTIWDRTSTVTVRVKGSLSSDTETNLLNGTNHVLLGSEVMQFANATLNADGTYTLDTFLRGRRGTEWATATHVQSEPFVLLDTNSLRRLDAEQAQRDYKAVSFGSYLDAAENVTFTNSNVSLKPFSPTFVKGSRDGSNNLTITWLRRSRYVGLGLNPLPLFEESESYEVDIMSGETVLRTIPATSETAGYTAALQTSDGLTPGDPITVRVYQLSATVGRGYKEEVTI